MPIVLPSRRSSVPLRPPHGPAFPRWILVVAAVALPARARAQDYVLDRAVSISAGAAQFDLSGTGTTPMIALRADAELTRWLVGELGVSSMRPKEDFGRQLTYVTPELQLQLQVRAGGLRPYVGAGAGYWTAIGPGRQGLSRGSGSAAAGLRINFADPRFGMRFDARLRGIGRDFAARTAEFTGGIALRF